MVQCHYDINRGWGVMAKPGTPCIFMYVIQIPETFASTEAAEWAGS